MSNETIKAQYLATFRVNTGAVHSVPVSYEGEINTSQDMANMINTVSKYAVAQGLTRGLDDVTVTSLSLLNPNREATSTVSADQELYIQALEKAVVDLYEGTPTSEAVDEVHAKIYEAIKQKDAQ